MRKQFDEYLSFLHAQMIEMCRMCEGAIDRAQRILEGGDEKMFQEMAEGENAINQKEKEIERLCLNLMLLQAPVAKDLRNISSALKMITDLERIGDQAEDIAEIVETGQVQAEAARTVRLEEMAEAASHMVQEAVNAYVENDPEKAHSVIAYDDVVDGLFEECRQLLTDLFSIQKLGASEMLDLLMIAKYYERIGDHASNIAEWALFGMTGMHDHTENA